MFSGPVYYGYILSHVLCYGFVLAASETTIKPFLVDRGNRGKCRIIECRKFEIFAADYSLTGSYISYLHYSSASFSRPVYIGKN
jgi:hypothetical protein